MLIKIVIISTMVLVVAFKFLLDFLNVKNRGAVVPKSVSDIYDEETYKKRNAYEAEKLRVKTFSGIVSFVITLLCLILNVHNWLFEIAVGFSGSIYVQSLFMLGVLLLVTTIIGLPLDAYDTFKIEAKYGFNKSSVKTFIGDFIKQILIIAILFGGLLSLFILLYSALNDIVFIVFFFVLVAVVFCIMLLQRQFAKLFNKFTPLEDGELKTKLNELAQRVGFSIKNVYVMNASKRSTKSNAYFSGFGKMKSIVLYDTLIESMTPDEIVAVLAHEIGHAKHKHIVFGFCFSLVTMAIMMALAWLFVANPSISKAFGFSEANVAFGVYIFFIIFSPLSILIGIPTNIMSRKFEYQADTFAVKNTSGDDMVSALKKLGQRNYANLVPHPFVVFMTYSHPPLARRIEFIEGLK